MNEQSPEPEALKPREDGAAQAAPVESAADPKKKKHRSYRPSHKATFLSLGVIVIILAVNAGVIGFLLKSKGKSNDSVSNSQVTISPGVLDKLGVSNQTIGSSGVQLIVGPDAQFKGKVQVAGNTTLGGQLDVNGKINGSDATFTTLQGGNTSVSALNVNGDTTSTNLSLRGKLLVSNQSTFQGPVTMSQLLTITNSVNVQGNFAVGGVFSAGTFSANSLTSTSTLTIGGHIVTNGAPPSFSGSGSGALGQNGTASVSGSDTSGIINVNTGVNATAGTIGTLTFRSHYANLPRVVISLVSPGAISNANCYVYVIGPSTSGFSVGIGGGLPPGGFAIDYMVMQ